MKNEAHARIKINQLLEEGSLSLHTDLIHHPTGGDFFSLDTFNALVGLPLRAILDPVPTYNLLLILNLGLGAFACTALARTVVTTSHASTFAGIAFAFSVPLRCCRYSRSCRCCLDDSGFWRSRLFEG